MPLRDEYNQPEHPDEDLEEHVIRLTNVVQDLNRALHEQAIRHAEEIEDMEKAQHE